MEITTQPPKTKRVAHKLCGVLYLPPAPSLRKAGDWYGSRIAGVPLLLRNILTLLRSGIHEVIVYSDGPRKETDKLRQIILEDSRVGRKVQWVSNLDKLQETIQNREDRVLIFNGSVLHNQEDYRFLIDQPFREGQEGPDVVLADVDNLGPFLRSIQVEGGPTIPSASNRYDDNELHELAENPDCIIYVPGPTKNAVQRPDDFKAHHERLLEGSGLNHDSPVTRILSRPISRRLTRLFLKTPIHPNQITLLSFVLGIGSAGCFLQGTYWMNIWGGLLLVFSTWVDGADGEIARLKFMETEIGKKLDIYCDNIVHFLVFGAIGLGVSEMTGNVVYSYLGGLAGLGSLTAFFILSPTLLKNRSHITPGSPSAGSEKALAEKLANRDFIHFIMLMALVGRLDVFIFVAALGSNIFATSLIYSRILKPRFA